MAVSPISPMRQRPNDLLLSRQTRSLASTRLLIHQHPFRRPDRGVRRLPSTRPSRPVFLPPLIPPNRSACQQASTPPSPPRRQFRPDKRRDHPRQGPLIFRPDPSPSCLSPSPRQRPRHALSPPLLLTTLASTAHLAMPSRTSDRERRERRRRPSSSQRHHRRARLPHIDRK